jgi:hypothetical protein
MYGYMYNNMTKEEIIKTLLKLLSIEERTFMINIYISDLTEEYILRSSIFFNFFEPGYDVEHEKNLLKDIPDDIKKVFSNLENIRQ